MHYNPMISFEVFHSVEIILFGIELCRMLVKGKITGLRQSFDRELFYSFLPVQKIYENAEMA